MDLRGKVVDNSGAPVPGAQVSIGDSLTQADENGGFVFRDLQKNRPIAIKVSCLSKDGNRAECREVRTFTTFYALSASAGNLMAVKVVGTKSNEPVVLALNENSQESLDGYCMSCHNWDPCFEGLSLEQLQANNRPTPYLFPNSEEMQKFIDRVSSEGVDVDSYGTCLYQTIHPLGADMKKAELGVDAHPGTSFKFPEGLVLCQDRYLQCVTCHTNHLATLNGSFLRLPLEDNALCDQCHL
ncbi:carboxypeptidase regulatory-like domain-containing protein [bacterium]|nr:MAG: carboxypeptidase regulatory-like domain-containing protein [bacterium]